MDAHKSTVRKRKSTGFLKAVSVRGVSKRSRNLKKEGLITISDPACVAELNDMISDEEFETILDNLSTREWGMEEFLVTFETRNTVNGGITDVKKITARLTNPDMGDVQGTWSNRAKGEEPKATPARPTSFDLEPTGAGDSKCYGDLMIIGHFFRNFEIVYWEGDVLMNAKVTNVPGGRATPVEWQGFFTDLILYNAGRISEEDIKDSIKALVKEPTPMKVGFKCHRIEGGSVGIVLTPSKETMHSLDDQFGDVKTINGFAEKALGTYDWETQFVHEFDGMYRYLENHCPRMPSAIEDIESMAGIDFKTPSARTVLGKDEDTFDFTIIGPEALGAKLVAKFEANEMNEMTKNVPAEVQKAMRIMKAWNQFQRVLKTETFTMDGAEDEVTTKEDGAKVAMPDANEIVDAEYENTGVSGSALDAADVPAVSEDESADAEKAEEAVVKSAKRLFRSLMLKAEEANPDMTDEESEEAEDAIIEDLSDEKKTEEVEKCFRNVDAKLAMRLHKHARLLKALKKAEGAEALPETKVEVDDGKDIKGSAVEDAGTEKIDSTSDLEDEEAPLVNDDYESENPAIPEPKEAVEVADTVGTPTVPTEKSRARKAHARKGEDVFGASAGMSITDMIAAKRGMNQREESAGSHREIGFSFNEGETAPGTSVASNHNGYRTVRMGDGKVMFPPMKH